MKTKKTTAIFFNDLKEDAQKRIITHELSLILECEPDEITVESISVDDECYGYDKDPKKQELMEHIQVYADGNPWLLVWDCFMCEFNTVM